tara:strand:- start:645 stop:911 length:267 start_codon:yes stop_codon:yes gene_type:complete
MAEETYYQKHKVYLTEYNKLYREKNAEKIKQRNIINRDHIREYHKEWRDKNREKQKEKILCECGCLTTRWTISRHRKSNKHIKNLNEK